MLGNVRGMILFEASGDGLYKFINAVRAQRIICTSQRCIDGKFTAEAYGGDLGRLRYLAQETGIELTVKEKRGIRYRLEHYRYRFGIPVGIVLMLCFVFYFTNTVVTIEVVGNTAVPENEVIDALADTGIYKGCFIPDIDFHRSEQRLRLMIPELSWTGIRHTGSRIVVDVSEACKPPENVRDNIPCNIVASRDAQITYTETRSGKLCRRCGDGVHKGDVLISGIVETGTHTLKKHAMGVIRGVYSDKVTFTQELKEEGQVSSGRTEKRHYLDFFGLRIPLFLKNVEADAFDYSETEDKLGSLPLGIVHCRYEPFTYDTVTYDEGAADERLQQKTARYEKNFIDSKGIRILERKIEKKTDSERMTYVVTYKLEGEIGEDSEIYVR